MLLEGPQRCPYDVLGLSEDAAESEIKRAYRGLALQWHPDKSPPEERAAAEELFKALGHAYDLLRDPVRRKDYDESQGIFRLGHKLHRPVVKRWAACRRSRSSPCGAAAAATAADSPQVTSQGAPATWLHTREWTPTPPPASCYAGIAWAAGAAASAPSSRVWFARGSACVGRAYKGLEAEDIARERQSALEAVGRWASAHPYAVVDIRGCSTKGEVGPRQRDSMGLARCERTLEFMGTRCGVPIERCYASRRLCADFQGVELRAMIRLEVDGTFEAKGSYELQNKAVLGDVAGALARSTVAGGLHVVIEVFGVGGATRLAERRVAALRSALASAGVSKHRISGRARVGLAEEAAFLIYEELPQIEEPAF